MVKAEAAVEELIGVIERSDRRQAKDETAEDLARLKVSFPTPRDAVAYIMDTFPIVKRKEEDKWGDYRTKLTILDIHDRMQKGMDAGQPYQTVFDPPPADPRVAHPAPLTPTP